MNKWLISGVMAIFAVTAVADDNQADGFYIYPHISLYNYDELLGTDIENDTGFGAAIGYHVDNNWAWELSWDSIDSNAGSVDVDTELWQLNSVYRFDTDTNWRALLLVGLGEISDDFGDNNTFTADATTFNFGGGLEYLMGVDNNLAIRADIRGIHHFDHSAIDVMTTIGLNFLFGGSTAAVDSDGDGVIDSKDRCPTTAAGVKVDARGCELDSDNDGVVDSADQCPTTPEGVAVDSKGCALDTDGDGVADYKDQCPATPAGALVDENGCRKALTEDVAIKLHLIFDTNKADIKANFAAQIADVAKFMRQYPDTQVTIEGHTDSMGAASYNQSLSQKRAEAVANSLVNDHSVNADRVSFVGYGEEKPVADNATNEGRQQNRRVVAQISATVTKSE